MPLCTFAELATSRSIAETFLRAAGAPGWRPDEKRALAAAGEAIWAARGILQADLDRPLERRRRAAAAAAPPVVPSGLPAMNAAEAAEATGLPRAVVYQRVAALGLGHKGTDGGLRLSNADLVAIKGRGHRRE